jgi:hypothetical protein
MDEYVEEELKQANDALSDAELLLGERFREGRH